jgi:hypothetical protein
MKDRQVARVYAWEHEWPTWNKPTITSQDCRKIVAYACKLYDVPVPKLKFPRGLRGCSYYEPNEHYILLRKRHRNIAVCLHEASHAIHSFVCGDEKHEMHGPEWLSIYLWLLRHAEVASTTALLESASAYNVKFLDLETHGPKRLRRTYSPLWKAQQQNAASAAA